MVSLKIVSILIVVGLLGAVCLGVAALSAWSQQITWSYSQVNEDFSVLGEQSVNYGEIIGEAVKHESYVVTNTGNTEVTVRADAVVSGNATSVSWDKTEASLAVGGNATFNLTLVISGAGSCTVSFSKAP